MEAGRSSYSDRCGNHGVIDHTLSSPGDLIPRIASPDFRKRLYKELLDLYTVDTLDLVIREENNKRNSPDPNRFGCFSSIF